jgi:hypothetical protein
MCAFGLLNTQSPRHLEAIPGKHSTDSLQKTAMLAASHVIMKVLQSDGDHCWFKRRSTGKKTHVTRDDDDNNNNNNIIIIIIIIIYLIKLNKNQQDAPLF